MTNLSDLLPSGGGAKEATAIAFGTLSTGQTVALRSDGKVEAIAQTSQAAGSTLQWGPSTATYLSATPYGSVYDPDSQRVIVAYYDGNNNYYGYCVVGEVDPSNNTITFGTPAMFQQNFVIVHSIGYDTTNDKVVVFSQNVNAGSAGQAKVGVVSGNSISFPSSPTAFNSSSTEDITAVFNPDEGNFLIVFKDNGNSGRPTGIVGTISGTTMSFGSKQAADSVTASYLALTYNTTVNRYVFIYNDNQFTNVAVQLPTTSGSTVTFGGAVAFVPLNGSTSVQSDYTNLVSDDASNTVFIITANTSNSRYPSAIAATIPSSGNTITFGTEVFFNGSSRVYSMGAAYDGNAKKLVISYADANQYGNVVAASVSGTTLTFGSPIMFRTALTGSLSNAFDSSANRILVTYTENNTGYAGALVFAPEATNVANFIGITSEPITSGNSGKYNPQGGVATTTEPSAGETGTPTAFTGSIGANDVTAVYDSGSNQVVFGFQNPATGYGSAIVGSINSANNTNTLGAVGIYQALSSSYNAITYDASADKIVAVASNPTSFNYNGYAWVGTVSGSGITFGSGVNYNGVDTIAAQDITYDSTSQVTVVCYKQYNDLYARLGTISGGAITFGSASGSPPNPGSVSYINAIYDSNADRTVVACQIAGVGLGVVAGQVSGGTISWGSFLYPAGGANVVTGEGHTICFDSQNNKVVVPYEDTSDNLGKVVVCNVSGSTVTAGSPVPFTSVAISGTTLQSAFDSSLNKVIITYTHSSDNFLRIITGTVSGTSISFDTPIVVTSAAINTTSTAIAYDSNANRSLISYRDQTSSFLGNAIVYVTAGTQSPLTIDSTYYIQNNGNITTTATGNTEIGKAVTTTQLLLKGAP